jgi:large subunit ribosomal protein L21
LLVNNEGTLTVGSPFTEGAKVTGEAIKKRRGKKVVIFKRRCRKDNKQNEVRSRFYPRENHGHKFVGANFIKIKGK